MHMEEEDLNWKNSIEEILEKLSRNDKIIFKSQQRNEKDLTQQEKNQIARDIYDKSKSNFIARFGKYLSMEDLNYFRKYESEDEEGSEIKLLLRPLIEHTKNLRRDRKNRRFNALKELIKENSYFSEVEMMKRNPLLYEQLVGQYLSEEEKKERDSYVIKSTFVNILMEGIERDRADDKRKLQQENEDNAMEEEDDSNDFLEHERTISKPSTSQWGEFLQEEKPIRRYAYNNLPQKFITKEERELLRNEFVTLMHRSFLDGNDEEFDYETVDNNESYDDIELIDHDSEDKYFDDEEPEANKYNQIVESSEDELDIYMNALNQHPSVCQLSQDLKKL